MNLNRKPAAVKRLLKVFLYLFLSSVHTLSYALPETSAVPGGIIVIPLDQNRNRPKVNFKKNRVMVIRENNAWYAIVGIPLNLKPGRHYISIQRENNNHKSFFNVAKKAFFVFVC